MDDDRFQLGPVIESLIANKKATALAAADRALVVRPSRINLSNSPACTKGANDERPDSEEAHAARASQPRISPWSSVAHNLAIADISINLRHSTTKFVEARWHAASRDAFLFC